MSVPAAFMSYVRFDDRHDDGWITRFRERLNAEVRARTGNEFVIFQDRNDIAWGQNWQQRIDEALDTATLLLVIITPSLFRSPACRAEVNRFLDRERALGREDLILPVYYISAREMDDPRVREGDDIAKVLASRQLADCRELRLKPFTSPKVRKAIVQLASRINDAFWQPPVAGSSAGSVGQAGGADRVTARTKPPTRMANADRQQESAGTSRGQRRLRYALAVLGSLLIALGVWALLAFSGRPQALLSAFIVLGIVFVLMSVLRFKRKQLTIEFILAVVGVLTLPYAVWTLGAQGASSAGTCTNGIFAHRGPTINWAPYRTDSISVFASQGGIRSVYYPYLRWAGYFIPLPDQLCSYQVTFFARELRPASTPIHAGWGYGLGVCDAIGPTEPKGFSFQYALYQQSQSETIGEFSVVYLPNANTYPNGVAQGAPYPLDYGWHQWTLTVTHNEVQVYFDDDYKVAQQNLTGAGLPADCASSGVFMRVWGGTAEFRDLSITPIADSSQ
jgi:hypothetical protein